MSGISTSEITRLGAPRRAGASRPSAARSTWPALSSSAERFAVRAVVVGDQMLPSSD
jgi:hypothetical protein